MLTTESQLTTPNRTVEARNGVTYSQVTTESATETPGVGVVEMKLEVVLVPVSDVDRAKSFYERLGWRLDARLSRR
jgi:hypothetical protein